VLSVRRGINVFAPCISELTEFEKELWNRTEKYLYKKYKGYNVCAYLLDEAELPLAMESHGFKMLLPITLL